MTPSDIPGDSTLSRVVPQALPEFACFAVKRKSDGYVNAFLGQEARMSRHLRGHRLESFQMGRAAAHVALEGLGRNLGPIGVGEHREPVWPNGVIGSISHTNDLAVALVAPAEATDGVGVDIEERRYAPELADQVPRPEEAEWLSQLSDDDREASLLALFSAKETIFKAFFPRVGSFFGFDVALLHPEPAGFSARLSTSSLDPDYPPDREFPVTCEWFGDLVLTTLVLPATQRVRSDH